MTTNIKLRVAVAGAGMVTGHHLRAWGRLPQVEVVAICARHLANAGKRAAEFDIPAAYDNIADMLDREKPDALDIATPPQVHREQANMAGLKRFLIMELLVHHLDTIRYLVGPLSVMAAGIVRISPEVIGNELKLIGGSEKTVKYNLEQAYQQSYDNAIEHFVEALEHDAPFETDRLDNLKTLQLVDDAYRKAERIGIED